LASRRSAKAADFIFGERMAGRPDNYIFFQFPMRFPHGDGAASKITVQGARYPEKLEQMTGR
jgi:hypothetical protein